MQAEEANKNSPPIVVNILNFDLHTHTQLPILVVSYIEVFANSFHFVISCPLPSTFHCDLFLLMVVSSAL